MRGQHGDAEEMCLVGVSGERGAQLRPGARGSFRNRRARQGARGEAVGAWVASMVPVFSGGRVCGARRGIRVSPLLQILGRCFRGLDPSSIPRRREVKPRRLKRLLQTVGVRY